MTWFCDVTLVILSNTQLQLEIINWSKHDTGQENSCSCKPFWIYQLWVY